MIQVPSEQWLTLHEERAEYDKHENSLDDEGYRVFLNRMAEPMIQRLLEKNDPSRLAGLDFGSGPVSMLSSILKRAGFDQCSYDIFYKDDQSLLQGQNRYDFITATEVFEHLKDPKLEFKRLWQLLKPGGHLGIMTKRVLNQDAFAGWHYKNDPTHIIFFSDKTFHHLADVYQADLSICGPDTVIFTKR